MKLIVGLGNPGTNYTKTRHNFGFMAADQLKNELAPTGDWRADESFRSLIYETEFGGEKIILAKPQTMMNASGSAVKSLADYFKIAPENIWVVHDDLDLPLGILRISQDANSAGHQGVQSIIKELATKNFVRLRLGIHPVGQTFFHTFFKKLTSTKKFVLQKFSKVEEPIAEQTVIRAASVLVVALKEGPDKAKNQFN